MHIYMWGSFANVSSDIPFSHILINPFLNYNSLFSADILFLPPTFSFVCTFTLNPPSFNLLYHPLFLHPLNAPSIFSQFVSAITSIHSPPGPRQRGEGPDTVWPDADQEALPADLHPHPWGAAVLLNARPGQRGLPHHDGTAGGDGVCYRRPQTAPVWPHRQKPGKQEPPEALTPEVWKEGGTQDTLGTNSFYSVRLRPFMYACTCNTPGSVSMSLRGIIGLKVGTLTVNECQMWQMFSNFHALRLSWRW